jgi:ketosteroid isomerase-like protein
MSAGLAARDLVESFGSSEAVLVQLAPGVVWTLHLGTGSPAGTHVGREAVEALIQKVFGPVYRPETVRVTVHDAFGEGERGVVRFLMQATTSWGASYANEYALFVRTSPAGIVEVNEYLDGVKVTEQLTPPGR